MHLLHYFLYALLIAGALLLPGYALITWLRPQWSAEEKFAFAYAPSLALYAVLGVIYYVTPLPRWSLSFLLGALITASAVMIFWQRRHSIKLPWSQLAVWALALLSLIYIALPMVPTSTFMPDPEPVAGRAYDSFNVKVLNVSHTRANDNYIPYRQAQLLVNKLDISTTPFIKEWGVTFFFRTPLMGAVVTFFFAAFDENVPTAYLWALPHDLQGHTYQHFQIIAHLLNALLLLPGFLLLKRFFGGHIGRATLALAVISPFFIYNSFFSWPKSLVAYFVLLSLWVLVKRGSPFLAGALMGIAYLTHDLAALYLFGSAVYLIIRRRWHNLIIFTTGAGLLASIWYIISHGVYHQSSLFLYYPFSLHDIPSDPSKVISEFFHTSPLVILGIKLDSILFLITPYQLYHLDGQDLWRQLWATVIFSIPGAVGLGLAPFTLTALFTYWRQWQAEIISFLFTPIIACVLVIGWPSGLGALHFAEPVVLLLMGLGVAFLARLNRFWRFAVLALLLIQSGYILLYGFNFAIEGWLSSIRGILLVSIALAIIVWATRSYLKSLRYPANY